MFFSKQKYELLVKLASNCDHGVILIRTILPTIVFVEYTVLTVLQKLSKKGTPQQKCQAKKKKFLKIRPRVPLHTKHDEKNFGPVIFLTT